MMYSVTFVCPIFDRRINISYNKDSSVFLAKNKVNLIAFLIHNILQKHFLQPPTCTRFPLSALEHLETLARRERQTITLLC